MTVGPLDVTVIVVGFNDRDSLPGCVDALTADPAAATRVRNIDPTEEELEEKSDGEIRRRNPKDRDRTIASTSRLN